MPPSPETAPPPPARPSARDPGSASQAAGLAALPLFQALSMTANGDTPRTAEAYALWKTQILQLSTPPNSPRTAHDKHVGTEALAAAAALAAGPQDAQVSQRRRSALRASSTPAAPAAPGAPLLTTTRARVQQKEAPCLTPASPGLPGLPHRSIMITAQVSGDHGITFIEHEMASVARAAARRCVGTPGRADGESDGPAASDAARGTPPHRAGGSGSSRRDASESAEAAAAAAACPDDARHSAHLARKRRTRTSRPQLTVLLRVFEQTPTPPPPVCAEIAARIGMTTRAVQVWFQNRRAKRRAVFRQQARATGDPRPPLTPALSASSLASSTASSAGSSIGAHHHHHHHRAAAPAAPVPRAAVVAAAGGPDGVMRPTHAPHPAFPHLAFPGLPVHPVSVSGGAPLGGADVSADAATLPASMAPSTPTLLPSMALPLPTTLSLPMALPMSLPMPLPMSLSMALSMPLPMPLPMPMPMPCLLDTPSVRPDTGSLALTPTPMLSGPGLGGAASTPPSATTAPLTGLEALDLTFSLGPAASLPPLLATQLAQLESPALLPQTHTGAGAGGVTETPPLLPIGDIGLDATYPYDLGQSFHFDFGIGSTSTPLGGATSGGLLSAQLAAGSESGMGTPTSASTPAVPAVTATRLAAGTATTLSTPASLSVASSLLEVPEFGLSPSASLSFDTHDFGEAEHFLTDFALEF